VLALEKAGNTREARIALQGALRDGGDFPEKAKARALLTRLEATE
jgi:hypothetical protein